MYTFTETIVQTLQQIIIQKSIQHNVDSEGCVCRLGQGHFHKVNANFVMVIHGHRISS